MNISRNVFLAALVTLGLPVLGSEGQAAPAPVTPPVKVETAPVVVATDKPAATTPAADQKAEGKGIFATVGSWAWAAGSFPFTTLPDWIANKAGAERFAKWLGALDKEGNDIVAKDDKGNVIEKSGITKFFANNVTAFKRLFAVAETAVVAAAIYKAYEMFVAEDNDADEEYVDIFEEEYVDSVVESNEIN